MARLSLSLSLFPSLTLPFTYLSLSLSRSRSRLPFSSPHLPTGGKVTEDCSEAAEEILGREVDCSESMLTALEIWVVFLHYLLNLTAFRTWVSC